MPKQPSRVALLRIAAGLFGLAGAYHVFAMVWPTIDPGSGAVRHAVFALIDYALGFALWWRPRGLFWVFAALGIEQLYSHGRALLLAWQTQHRINWASALVIIGLPLVCCLLYAKPTSSKVR